MINSFKTDRNNIARSIKSIRNDNTRINGVKVQSQIVKRDNSFIIDGNTTLSPVGLNTWQIDFN